MSAPPSPTPSQRYSSRLSSAKKASLRTSSRDMLPETVKPFAAVDLKISHIRITHFSEHGDHALYHIRCEAQSKQFMAQRRFREFLTLHEILVGVVELPTDFPVAKSMFPTTEVKNSRMRELQEYLRVVSTLCESRPPRAFVEFLGIDPDETLASPGLIVQREWKEAPSHVKALDFKDLAERENGPTQQSSVECAKWVENGRSAILGNWQRLFDEGDEDGNKEWAHGKKSILYGAACGCAVAFLLLLVLLSLLPPPPSGASVPASGPMEPPLPPSSPSPWLPPPSPRSPLASPPPPPLTWVQHADMETYASEYMTREATEDVTSCKTECIYDPICHGFVIDSLGGSSYQCRFFQWDSFDLHRSSIESPGHTLYILWGKA